MTFFDHIRSCHMGSVTNYGVTLQDYSPFPQFIMMTLAFAPL